VVDRRDPRAAALAAKMIAATITRRMIALMASLPWANVGSARRFRGRHSFLRSSSSSFAAILIGFTPPWVLPRHTSRKIAMAGTSDPLRAFSSACESCLAERIQLLHVVRSRGP
jgi:hypothetical protein